LHGAQNIPTKLWMDSSCHLLPSCKNSDAKETSTKCNKQKEKLVHHEKNQMQIIDSTILPLFFLHFAEVPFASEFLHDGRR
jgi:hypothetical protein